MDQARRAAWLERRRGHWISASLALIALYTAWVWTIPNDGPIGLAWLLRLVVPAWILGIDFAAGLDLVRPIHPEPAVERGVIRLLYTLLVFPFSLVPAAAVIAVLIPVAGGVSIDTSTDVGASTLLAALLGPVIVGLAVAGWFILTRRGTRTNRHWFAGLVSFGTIFPLWMSGESFAWFSHAPGSGAVPFLAAASAIVLSRIWRRAAAAPQDVTITIGEPDRPTFHRAKF